MIINHKYNTRYKNSLLMDNEENNFIDDTNHLEEEMFDHKKFSKLLYQKFPTKYTLHNLKKKVKTKKPNRKNIKIQIKNCNGEQNKNKLGQKQFYFNRLKRNCTSPIELSNKKRNKNNDYENDINSENDNKKFTENKIFRIFIDTNDENKIVKKSSKNKEIVNEEEDEEEYDDEEEEYDEDYDSDFTLHDSSDEEELSEEELSEEELSEEDNNELLNFYNLKSKKQEKCRRDNESLEDKEIFKTKEQEKEEENEEDKIKKELEEENKKLVKEYKNILKTENNSIEYFKQLDINEKKKLLDKIKYLNEKASIPVPYEVHVINLEIEEKYKISVFNKIKNLTSLSKDTSSSEYIKLKNWIENFTKIPFNNYSSLPITINDGYDKCRDYIINAKKILDEATYGLNDAKMQLLQFLAQLINNPDSNGLVLGIKGPMGTGKTTLIKDGISKILNRPFEFIPLAGVQDGTYFEGHSYTYEGSRHGKIVDILIQSNCMNPIIYGDELDKVSAGIKGDEIIGLLTHLTDVTQSSNFNDKYFSELNLNLNKIIYIFSYNDENLINPILRDRMYKIETNGYNLSDKIVISHNYLIPKILKEINSNTKVKISDENIKFIVQNYTDNEKGVRNLKRCLETIYNKLNLYNLINENEEFKSTFFKNFNYNENIDLNLNENQIKLLLSNFLLKSNSVPFGMYN